MAIAKLRRELARMDAASSVEAVFTLNLPKTESPDQVEARVNNMVAKAASSSGAKVERLSIKARIHTFVVKGPVALVDTLALDPLVYGGMLNAPQKDLLIRGTVKPLALNQRDSAVPRSLTARSLGSKTKAGVRI